MSVQPHKFARSADEAVKKTLREGRWAYWERYDVKELGDGDAYVVAGGEVSVTEYLPLVQTPALFLEFARLADEGEITCEVWLEWIHTYGVLGLDRYDPLDAMSVGLYGPVCQEGGPAESYNNFRAQARHANYLLRLEESVSSPGGTDTLRIFEEAYRRDDLGHLRRFGDLTPERERELARETVWANVCEEIRECHPTLVPADEGFVQGWGFDSLIAAMYLQFMWFLTATGDEIRWCARPECTRVIDFSQPRQTVQEGLRRNDRSMGYRTRTDKIFCSDRCRGLHYYHHVKKGKRERETWT